MPAPTRAAPLCARPRPTDVTGDTLRVDLSEDNLKSLLATTRGDLFQTACLCRLTFRELDGLIRRSDVLANYYKSIQQVKNDPEYSSLSDRQFAENVDYLVRQYRFEGLQVIHEIATMPADSAAMYDVKLKAAVQLRGGEIGAGGASAENILAELREAYEHNRPRIAEIRQTVIRLEDRSAPPQPVVLDSATHSPAGGAPGRSGAIADS